MQKMNKKNYMLKIKTYVFLFMFVLTFLFLDYTFVVKKPPKVVFKNKDIVLCKNDKKSLLKDVYALDSRGTDLTKKIKVTLDKDIATYKVVDRFNNKVEVKRKVQFDNIKPVITLNNDKKLNIKKITDYKEEYAKAYDNCDKDITKNIKITNNIVNNNEVIYEVIDSSNNKTVVKRKVNLKRKSNTKGVIYLTFDDGPHDINTPEILNILKKYNIHASFFVTGSGSDKYIKRAYDEGHTIALHTYSHDYTYLYKSTENYFKDLKKVEDRVYNILSIRPNIIRFPGGTSNTISKRYNKGIMSKLVPLVEKENYIYFDWNISAEDSFSYSTKDYIYNSVVDNLSKDKDNVILLHDTKANTKDVLEKIIKYAVDHSYEFKKITEDTKPVRHSINN